MQTRNIRLGQIGNSQTVAFAVRELAKYLKKMDSGILVDILHVEQVNPDFSGIIWVGLDETISHEVPTVEDPAVDDAIAVKVENGDGYITGSNERSVLLAAYRFLKALGCNWVRPGEAGERIPVRTIESINVSIFETPSYRHRGICIEGANTCDNVLETIDFLPKVGMNTYFIQFLLPATFFDGWYKNHGRILSRDEISAMVKVIEEEIARRGLSYHKVGHGWTCEPFGLDGSSWDANKDYGVTDEIRQYLAEVEGKRELRGNVPLNTNLCYSNAYVRDRMTDAIVQCCKDNPNIDVLHFWLADSNFTFCECTECAKKTPSDWYVLLLNELDAKMTAAGLDTKIVFIVYADILWAPLNEAINNQDRFILVFAPISRYFGQSYAECIDYDEEIPPFVLNKYELPRSVAYFLAHLRRWQAGFKGDSILFDYHLMWPHMADPGYERCARNLFDDMKGLHAIGLNGMLSCQVQRCFFPSALPFQVMAAALWDESSDFEQEALAYYLSAFGEDGPLVHEYLAAISSLMLMYDGPACGSDEITNGPFCKDYEKLKEVVAAFLPVIQRNVSKANPYQEEWTILQTHSTYVCLLAEVLSLYEQGKRESAKPAVDKLFDWIEKMDVEIQKAIDGKNTKYVWGRRLHL